MPRPTRPCAVIRATGDDVGAEAVEHRGVALERGVDADVLQPHVGLRIDQRAAGSATVPLRSGAASEPRAAAVTRTLPRRLGRPLGEDGVGQASGSVPETLASSPGPTEWDAARAVSSSPPAPVAWALSSCTAPEP